MDVLGEEEDLLIVSSRADLTESLEESVGGGREDIKLKLGEHVVLHHDHVAAGELVLGDAQQLLQAGWVDLLILGGDQNRGQSKDV